MTTEQTTPPLKHPSCKHFDDFISHLEKEHAGVFTLKKLGEDLGCSTERIRRIRIGQYSMDVNDITVLQEKYNANPLYLLSGVLPMQFNGRVMDLVQEASIVYGSGVLKDLADMQERLNEKERLIKSQEKTIALYEQRFVLEDVKKEKRA